MSWMQRSRFMDEAPRETSSKSAMSFAFRQEIKLGRTATPIIFVDAQYPSYGGEDWTVPYYEWRRHTFRAPGAGNGGRDFFRTFACGRGNQRGADCPACDLQFGPTKDKRLSIRNVRYWTAIALEHTYFMQNDFGETWYQTPETRAQERELEDKGGVPTFGRLGYIEVGKAHHANLMDIFERAAQMCTGCLEEEGLNGTGTLTTASYLCNSCGNELENIETTRLGRDAWREFGARKQKCSCGHNDLPHAVLECSQCKNPTPAEIFDLVFPLCKTGTGKDTAINLDFGAKPVFVDEYEITFDGRTGYLMDGLTENNERNWAPVIAEKYAPLDFDKIFEVERSAAYQQGILSK